MSTMSPKRKPRRMPCFTQTLTRQPVGEEASGSAARTLPSDSSSRKRRKTWRASSRGGLLPCSKSVVMCWARALMDVAGLTKPALPRPGSYAGGGAKHLQVLQDPHHFLARGRARRDERQSIVLVE